MKTTYLTLIRPVGLHCWTVERHSPTLEGAERQAAEERNRKIVFADKSVHLQSTAIIRVDLPGELDTSQQHWEPGSAATVVRSIA